MYYSDFMVNIQEVQREVLAAIREDGARVGIAYYRRYAHLYEALPAQQAALYWRAIFDEIERKERIIQLSLFAKDDPFIDKDPFSMSEEEFRKSREYRQTFYRATEYLDAKMANYILAVYDRHLEIWSPELRKLKSQEPTSE